MKTFFVKIFFVKILQLLLISNISASVFTRGNPFYPSHTKQATWVAVIEGGDGESLPFWIGFLWNWLRLFVACAVPLMQQQGIHWTGGRILRFALELSCFLIHSSLVYRWNTVCVCSIESNQHARTQTIERLWWRLWGWMLLDLGGWLWIMDAPDFHWNKPPIDLKCKSMEVIFFRFSGWIFFLSFFLWKGWAGGPIYEASSWCQ